MNLGTGFKWAGYVGVAVVFCGAIGYVNRTQAMRSLGTPNGELEAGSKPTLSYTVAPKAFQILDLNGPFRVKVRKGSFMPVRVNFHPQASRLVKMEESEGRLTLRWLGASKRSKLIDVEVSAPNLAEVHLMGRARLEMDRCEYPILRIFSEGFSSATVGEVEHILVAELNGYSTLKATCKNAYNIDLKVLDAAKADVTGSAQRLTGWLEGNGKIFSSTKPLAVRRASVKSYGDTRVQLSTVERMDSWIGGRSVQQVETLPKTIITRTSEDGLMVVNGQPRVWPHDSKLRALTSQVASVVNSTVQGAFIPTSGQTQPVQSRPGA